MRKLITKITTFSLSLFVSGVSFAKTQNFGQVAAGLFSNVEDFSDIMHSLSILAGAFFLLFSLLQYRKHRHNPDEVGIGTPIMSFIIGAALICLGIILKMQY